MKPTAIIHGQPREIMGSELTDAQVASGIFMNLSPSYEAIMDSLKVDASDLAKVVPAIPQIARDRILYLSQRLERAEAMLGKVVEVEIEGGIDTILNFLREPTTRASIEPDVMKRA